MIFSKAGETVYRTETVYDDATGLPVRQLTWKDDKLQSPPDDSPAQVLFDREGQIREMVWWEDGKEHRDITKGASTIKINPKTGVHTQERYMIAGELSRSLSEPAIICRHPETGLVTRVEYFVQGVRVPHPPPVIDPTL